MNESNSLAYDDVDLSSLSKEDLLRVIAEQNRALKAKDKEIDPKDQVIKTKDKITASARAESTSCLMTVKG